MGNVTDNVVDVRPYIVRQGDYVARTAAAIGCSEEEIWDYEKNRELKAHGRTEEVLNPGDILYVPDRRLPGVAVTLQADNAFAARVPAVMVRVKFMVDGAPRANQKYTVECAGGPVEGTSDGEGVVEFDVSTATRSVIVVFDDPPGAYALNIGGTDPATVNSGVFGRLRQLGYFGLSTDRDAVSDEDLAAALASFQQSQGVEPTGEMDEETRRRLETAFGS